MIFFGSPEHAAEAYDEALRFDDPAHGGCRAYGPDYPTSIRCKLCGKGPFEWENFGTSLRFPLWKLVDDDGAIHDCRKATAEEFPLV